MNETPSSAAPSPAEVRLLLETIAQLLRHTHHLGTEAQLLLADLVEELGRSLAQAQVSAKEMAHLTESASHLVQVAIQEDERPGMLDAARSRMEKAAVAVETGSPVLAGLARRLAEMLSNLGI
jgi:hypothetical protein